MKTSRLVVVLVLLVLGVFLGFYGFLYGQIRTAVLGIVLIVISGYVLRRNSEEILDSIYEYRIKKWEANGDINNLVKALLRGVLNISVEEDLAFSALKSLGYKPGFDKQGAIYWVAENDYKKCVKCGELAIAPLIKRAWRHSLSYQESAVSALGKIGGTKAVRALISLLRRHPYVTIRKRAADALGKIGDRRAVRPLIAAFKAKQRSSNPKYSFYSVANIENERINIASALGKIGGKRAEKFLDKELSKKMPEYLNDLRSALQKALSNIRHP